MTSLADKVAIITGASKGVGREIARLFGREGASLILVARSASLLEEVTREAGSARAIVGDVRDEATSTRAVEAALDHFGHLDILVNNAGVAIHRPILELDTASYDTVMDTNMRATYLFSRAVVPLFLQQGHGTIINVGSGAATRGIATETAYCASKFAQRGFTLALDRELRSKNIKVSILLPGNIDTGFNGGNSAADQPDREGWLAAEDVSRAALFVATQEPQSHVLELVVRPMSDHL